MKKKANISMSFSLIFMIIIGCFFILLSFNIISKYKENQDAKYEFELKNALRNKFNQFGRTSGIEESSIVPINNIFYDNQIKIICQNDFAILAINQKLDAKNEFLQNYPTFMTFISQNKIDNSFLYIENFYLPFKITNLLAIISKRNLIIIDKNSQFGKKFYKKLKKKEHSNNLNYHLEDFQNLNFQNFKQKTYVKNKKINSVVFVTDDNLNLNFDIKKINFLANIVKIKTEDEFFGKIIFKDQNSKEYTYNYYDAKKNLALQTMAIFSTPNTFNCSYNLLTNLIENKYNFYLSKTKNYLEKSKNQKICSTTSELFLQEQFYKSFLENLNSTKNFIKNQKLNSSNQLKNKLNTLNQNQEIFEENNCPYIY